MMRFTDYDYSEGNLLECEEISDLWAYEGSVRIIMDSLNPESLIRMIMKWDDDVVWSLIEELKSRLKGPPDQRMEGGKDE